MKLLICSANPAIALCGPITWVPQQWLALCYRHSSVKCCFHHLVNLFHLVKIFFLDRLVGKLFEFQELSRGLFEFFLPFRCYAFIIFHFSDRFRKFLQVYFHRDYSLLECCLLLLVGLRCERLQELSSFKCRFHHLVSLFHLVNIFFIDRLVGNLFELQELSRGLCKFFLPFWCHAFIIFHFRNHFRKFFQVCFQCERGLLNR